MDIGGQSQGLGSRWRPIRAAQLRFTLGLRGTPREIDSGVLFSGAAAFHAHLDGEASRLRPPTQVSER